MRPPGSLPGSPAGFESKAAFIARAIRSWIVSGEIEAGSSLKQRDLAKLFGVSPTPVREALSRLEAEGYVANRLHQGAVVRDVRDRVDENWRLRAYLEPLATRLAVPNITDNDVAEIGRRAAVFADAGPDEAPQRNVEFHLFIYERSDSPVLVRFISELWQTIDLEPTTLRDHEVSVAEHAAIVEAIAKRDVEAASTLVHRHIRGTARRPDPID